MRKFAVIRGVASISFCCFISFCFISQFTSALNLGIYLATVYRVFFRIIVLLQQNFAG